MQYWDSFVKVNQNSFCLKARWDFCYVNLYLYIILYIYNFCGTVLLLLKN